MRLYSFTQPSKIENVITIDLDHVLAMFETSFVRAEDGSVKQLPVCRVFFRSKEYPLIFECEDERFVQQHEDMTKKLIAAWRAVDDLAEGKDVCKAPKCAGRMIPTGEVLTSIPMKYSLRCNACGVTEMRPS